MIQPAEALQRKVMKDLLFAHCLTPYSPSHLGDGVDARLWHRSFAYFGVIQATGGNHYTFPITIVPRTGRGGHDLEHLLLSASKTVSSATHVEGSVIAHIAVSDEFEIKGAEFKEDGSFQIVKHADSSPYAVPSGGMNCEISVTTGSVVSPPPRQIQCLADLDPTIDDLEFEERATLADLDPELLRVWRPPVRRRTNRYGL